MCIGLHKNRNQYGTRVQNALSCSFILHIFPCLFNYSYCSRLIIYLMKCLKTKHHLPSIYRKTLQVHFGIFPDHAKELSAAEP